MCHGAAAREMVKAASNKEEHEYGDAIAAEDALLVVPRSCKTSTYRVCMRRLLILPPGAESAGRPWTAGLAQRHDEGGVRGVARATRPARPST